MNEELVLCGANAAKEKYFFNPRYGRLPEAVQEELRTAVVLFAARTGGTVLLCFDEEGPLKIQLVRGDADIYYDEIEAGVALDRLRLEKEELFRQLETFYRAFFRSE